MAARSFVPLGLFLALIGGCTGQSVGLVDFITAGGLSGNGDGTALHVEPSGEATRTKPDGSMEAATLDVATLNDLHQKIEDAQFATLAPEYVCTCPDEFINVVSAQVNGKVYRVAAGDETPYPEPLKIVISTLRDIQRSALGWH
jgi:hypothetical protein